MTKQMKWGEIPTIHVDHLKKADDFQVNYTGKDGAIVVTAHEIQWHNTSTKRDSWDSEISFSPTDFEPTFTTKVALMNGEATERDFNVVLGLKSLYA